MYCCCSVEDIRCVHQQHCFTAFLIECPPYGMHRRHIPLDTPLHVCRSPAATCKMQIHLQCFDDTFITDPSKDSPIPIGLILISAEFSFFSENNLPDTKCRISCGYIFSQPDFIILFLVNQVFTFYHFTITLQTTTNVFGKLFKNYILHIHIIIY